ncbi:unnamed protein product [Protopolystoma xenopodis]|uniref:Uncharacterized protein n=1 Tax=Protopolystoma xenopodis TaxID=117903 RepID=A0A3S5A568_9PLAT|nr:unnamed protein product [Protopolystoma xenopodis]
MFNGGSFDLSPSSILDIVLQASSPYLHVRHCSIARRASPIGCPASQISNKSSSSDLQLQTSMPIAHELLYNKTNRLALDTQIPAFYDLPEQSNDPSRIQISEQNKDSSKSAEAVEQKESTQIEPKDLDKGQYDIEEEETAELALLSEACEVASRSVMGASANNYSDVERSAVFLTGLFNLLIAVLTEQRFRCERPEGLCEMTWTQILESVHPKSSRLQLPQTFSSPVHFSVEYIFEIGFDSEFDSHSLSSKSLEECKTDLCVRIDKQADASVRQYQGREFSKLVFQGFLVCF